MIWHAYFVLNPEYNKQQQQKQRVPVRHWKHGNMRDDCNKTQYEQKAEIKKQNRYPIHTMTIINHLMCRNLWCVCVHVFYILLWIIKKRNEMKN